MTKYLALFFTLLSSVAFAQPEVDALRVYLGTSGSSCVLRSGTGVPSNSLGAVCDVYLRKDSPYTIYTKTGASTWTAMVRLPGDSGITTVGALSSGSISSAFGAIDVGADSITGGAGSFTTSMTTPSLLAAANLTISPTGDLVTDPTGNDILPGTGYDINIGSLTNKFLTLHAAELWVNTLVANATMATIGGRIVVGPTTELTSDLTSGATSISVKHNQMVNGDRVFLEANGALEWLAITSSPSGSGPYTYTVTRNLDGTGANAWSAGDAIFNTGQTGSGYMDLFSLGSSAFVGHSAIFNYDAALNAYSSNYFESDVWSPFSDAANNTVNDAIYRGAPAIYATLSTYVITPVSSSSTLVWEFWNGSAWTSFTPSGIGFGSVGPGAVTFGTLSGWATTTVNGINAYYVRLRISVVGGGTTAGVWRQTRRGPQQWGPTIIGNTRTSSTYNDIYPRWAIGNLNGTYGYGTTVFGAGFGDEYAANLTIDATNGIRFRNSSTTLMQLTSSELNLMNTGVIKSGSATALGTGTGLWIAAGSGTPVFRVGNPSADYLQWDGSSLSLKSTNATLDSNGLTMSVGASVNDNRAYRWGTSSSGRMGTYALGDTSGGNSREVMIYSEWTGVGNISSGAGSVSVSLYANHLPSSGGTSRNASLSLSAGPIGPSSMTLQASTVNIAATDTWDFSNDLRIYGNDGTTTSQPFIRGNGNYLVINSRSNANGGTLYFQQDVLGDIVMGVGGGTTRINTALQLVGLATCTLQVDGGGSVGCVSDSGAKRDIQRWTPGLDTISKLRPVSYKWKDGDQKTAIGFLAQDVEKVIPEAVRQQEWGGMLTLDDRAILAALVNAVQELQKRR